ncbi:MAG: long-chain-fatty-acid--CoA ligase [Dehalococcoidia bacterium]
MNTTEFLLITGSIVPDRPAIFCDGKKVTYAEVSDRVNRLANALIGLGVQKGDMVSILQVNCSQFVEAYFAAAKVGAIFVPLNFRAKSDELGYMLNNCEAKVLLVGERYVDLVNEMRPQLPKAEAFICIESKPDGMLSYDEVLASASPEEVFTEIDDDDVTILMYTAGTTGRPKGVPLTHNSFSMYVLNNVAPVDLEVEETNLLTVPLYHVAGVQAVMAAVYGGRTLAMLKQFEVKEWLRTVQEQKANRAMLVPTMLKRVIEDEDFDKYDLSSLRVITYGAAPMPFEVIKKAIDMFPGVMFINAFGQTETASTITSLGPDDHVITGSDEEKAKKLKRLQSSIGRPMDDVEIKIVDDDGKEVATGELGEILAKGPRVMSGYWKDEEKTAKALTADGWLRTSDRGYVDEEGYIYLAGRGDDMIIRGGENISPGEVEDVLYAHPKIDEAAVIGVPDPDWGQEPKAVVVLKSGETATGEEIMEFCRERLSSFKRPRYVTFVGELPRTSTGKVLKRDLRDEHGQADNN